MLGLPSKDADALLAVSGAKREKWLDKQAGVALKLPAKVKEGFKQASSLAELCLALGNRLSPHTPRGLAAGSLILQPTAERRRSGSHYTPRALTEPIVIEAFRPWLERCHHQPSAEQILALKVCDPAMGSGAFLVAVCRYLAGWLVKAWDNGDDHKAPTDSTLDKDLYARRLIAQSCLYGVDKNPFAVNLAKLPGVNYIGGRVPNRRRTALSINNPDQTHHLQHYRGGTTVSALQVVCILYVGVQLLLPGQDAGIDFAREYELAKGMAGADQ